MNVLAFSLFGPAPIYIAGMLSNARLAKEHYPGWRVVCYCDEFVPPQVKDTLTRMRVDVRRPDSDIANRMFDRFLVADDKDVERFVIRDADSRLGPRERGAVDDWIASDKDFHVMSDHPCHWPPIGGGLWGAKGGAIKGMKKMILESRTADQPYTKDTGYNKDQVFLRRCVLPLTKGRLLRHDSCCRDVYPDARSFPGGCCFDDNRFVGEVWDENDKPHPWHWQLRLNFMTT